MSENIGSDHCIQDAVSSQNITLSVQRHIGTSDMTHSLDESRLNDLDLVVKRPAHNAIERQRRENLNTKLQQLAHALPSLHSVRRPSKTIIVAKALEFVTTTIHREVTLQKKIDRLRQENESLRDEAERRTPTSLGTTAMTMRGTPTLLGPSYFADSLYMYPEQFVVKSQERPQQAYGGLPLAASEAIPPLSFSPHTLSAHDAEGPMIQNMADAASPDSPGSIKPRFAAAAAAATKPCTKKGVKRSKCAGETISKKRSRRSTYPQPASGNHRDPAHVSSQSTPTMGTPGQEFYKQQELATSVLDHHQQSSYHYQAPVDRTGTVSSLPLPLESPSAMRVQQDDPTTAFPGWPAETADGRMMPPFPSVMGTHFYDQW